MLVCQCKHTCSTSARPAAWAHPQNMSPAMASSRQRLFVSHMQSWGAVTWFCKCPTWQWPGSSWGGCFFGRERLITYPLCQVKGWDSYLRCVVFRQQKEIPLPHAGGPQSASPGSSPVKIPLVFQAFSSPRKLIADIFKWCC